MRELSVNARCQMGKGGEKLSLSPFIPLGNSPDCFSQVLLKKGGPVAPLIGLLLAIDDSLSH